MDKPDFTSHLIKQLPDEAFPSVAGEVMRRVEARDRRLAVVRWGAIVSTAAGFGIAMSVLGSHFLDYVFGLATRGGTLTGSAITYAKLVSILKMVGSVLGRIIVGETLGRDLAPYRAGVWVVAIGTLAIVVLMMYLLGFWLSKPKEGKSWRLRRTWYKGMPVW